jgi:type III secretion protein L
MAQAAIIDHARFELALDARVVRGEVWNDLADARALLDRAEACYRQAGEDATGLAARAREEGFAAGRAEGLRAVAATLVRVQRDSAALLAREESRIADLAIAIVSRIAPRLDPKRLVPALIAEAVREVSAEQFLQVRVHPDSFAPVEAELDEIRKSVPGVADVQVVADATQDPLGCVLASEAGKVEAGIAEQLAAIRAALHAVADSEPRA